MFYDEAVLRFIRQRLSRRHLAVLILIAQSQPAGITKEAIVRACKGEKDMSRPVIDSLVMSLYVSGLIDIIPDGPATLHHMNDNGMNMGKILIEDGTLTPDGELK